MPARTTGNKRQHIDLAVARRLKLVRQILGFTATDLDWRCGYGPGTFGRLERGDQRIYANHLYRLTEITGIGIDFFFSGIEDPAPADAPAGPVDVAQGFVAQGFDALLQSHNIQEIVERLMRVLSAESQPMAPSTFDSSTEACPDPDGDTEKT